MERIKRNDTVKVVAGKDRGKEGRVVRVYPKRGRVMVEGINIATKHKRVERNRRGDTSGGISHEEVPLEISNVMPICPSCGAPTRVGVRLVEGKRSRYCRKCEAEF